MLKKGRLSVCLPLGKRPSREARAAAMPSPLVQIRYPSGPDPGSGLSAQQAPHCVAFSGALLAYQQSPLKRALLRDVARVHPSLTSRDGVRTGRKEASVSREPAALSLLRSEESRGTGDPQGRTAVSPGHQPTPEDGEIEAG